MIELLSWHKKYDEVLTVRMLNGMPHVEAHFSSYIVLNEILCLDVLMVHYSK